MFDHAELKRFRYAPRPTSISGRREREPWCAQGHVVLQPEKAQEQSNDDGPSTISAVSALSGSAIGAMASFATTWLTQNHQDHMKRLDKEGSRRERLSAEFIDQASKAYADGVIQERLDDPAKLVPMYATINILRLFAATGGG